MTRSKSLTLAAILQFLFGVVDALSALPILAAGSAGLPAPSGIEGASGPPFWAGVLFLILAVATLFGAYGLWINQKWGKMLTIITRVVLGLFALGDVVAAAMMGGTAVASAFSLYVLLSVVVVFLVLRREPMRALAA